jgi:hypothetical protein
MLKIRIRLRVAGVDSKSYSIVANAVVVVKDDLFGIAMQ